MMMTVFLKSTRRRALSVRTPSSSTCSRTLNTSGCAFSISSSRTTEYGFRRTFNPEFLNRIDEIIVFDPLSDDDLRRILALLVDQLNEHLADRRLKISLTPEATDWIIGATCQDRSYGARPLRRAIQRYVEDPLSEELIRGRLRGGVVEVGVEGGALAYRPASPAPAGQTLA